MPCVVADLSHSSQESPSVNITRLLTLGLLIAAPVLIAGQDAVAADVGSRSERARLARDIVMKWGGHVQSAYRSDVGQWARDMVPLFVDVPLDSLKRAAAASSFDQMNSELLVSGNAPGAGSAPPFAASRNAPKVFGDVDKDLVFVPITPCRIIDTRVSGGAIAANTTRNFDVTSTSSYAGQGGSATDCNGAGNAGSYAAAAINFVAVTPSAGGYITAFPLNASQPTASTLNYTAGAVVANFAVVRLDQTAAADEMSVYTFAQTHLVADIVGYYRNSSQPVFECVDSGETINSVNAGATSNANAPACPAGYTQTATNCESSTWQMPFVYFSGGTCSAQNNSASTAQLRASRTCCRTRIP